MEKDQPTQIKAPSVWSLAAGMALEFGGDAANCCGKWAGYLGRRPRGCWVSLRWDYHGSVSMRGRPETRLVKWLRFLVENRSRFPIVIVEAGWVYRTAVRSRRELLVPLWGEAVVAPIRQEVAPKSSEWLMLDAGLAYRRHPKSLEELVGGDALITSYRSPCVAYVRLENGRIFRSYAFFGVGPIYVP